MVLPLYERDAVQDQTLIKPVSSRGPVDCHHRRLSPLLHPFPCSEHPVWRSRLPPMERYVWPARFQAPRFIVRHSVPERSRAADTSVSPPLRWTNPSSTLLSWQAIPYVLHTSTETHWTGDTRFGILVLPDVQPHRCFDYCVLDRGRYPI